jgi:Na+/melibiose symporter-like transporter
MNNSQKPKSDSKSKYWFICGVASLISIILGGIILEIVGINSSKKIFAILGIVLSIIWLIFFFFLRDKMIKNNDEK